MFRLGERVVDLRAAQVQHQGKILDLTPIEAKLLGHLARRSGEIVPREELLVEVWGYKPGVRTRTIDNTTVRLRAKIEDDAANPLFLHAVYGRGLRLDGVVPMVSQGAPTTRFVGREDDLGQLSSLLREGKRLVTVWGPAGVGKSRLVVEALPRLGLEVLEVSCVAARDAADLDSGLAQALGVVGQASPALGAALAGRGPLLLVLDNCEQLVDAVSDRVQRWLAEAPRLRVLVTSRIALGPSFEQQLGLGPLAEDSAVELFTERARQHDPRFQAPAATLAQLVGKVDHLPLAIELAAARVHLLGAARLLELLSSPFEVLSMAEVLDRSFALLQPEERRALVAASCFESSFDLDDFAAIAGLSRSRALAVLESLVAQALLRVQDADRRYTLYAVVRERGRQEEIPAIDRERHARWFSRLGDPVSLDRARFDSQVRRQMRQATPDLRSAMQNTLISEPELAARCGLALIWRMAREGPLSAGLELALALQSVPCSARVRVAMGVAEAMLCQMTGQYRSAVESIERVAPLAIEPADRVLAACSSAINRRLMGDKEGTERALEDVRSIAPQAGVIHAMWLQTRALYSVDTAGSHRMLVEAAHVASRHGDRLTEGASFALLAHACEQTGDWDGCRRAFRRAIEVFGTEEIALRNRATTLMMHGRLERSFGDIEAAEALLEQSIALCRQLGNLETEDSARVEMARAWFWGGLHQDALDALEPVLVRNLEMPNKNTAWALLLLAEIEEQRGEKAAARQALSRAREHAEIGRWEHLQSETLDILALLDGDESHLTTAAAIWDAPVTAARRLAIGSLLACAREDLAEAEALYQRGMEALDALRLRPESEIAAWMRRAERELAMRTGKAVKGRFGAA